MAGILQPLVKLALTSLLVCALASTAAVLLPPTIQAQPVLALSAGTARVGSGISVSGKGFLPTDTTCALSSPSSSALVRSSACITRGGSISGGFTVGNVMPGAYIVKASGNRGDFAEALLEVSGGAQLQLSPASGAPGVDVLIQGSGFLPTDNTCTISSPSSPNPILPGTAACVIRGGTGLAIGSFTIGSVPPGDYIIQVTGSQGDSVQALLDVG